jgi:hypothetical protein
MTDDGGVLGNLPNSRPGKRSDKRNAGAGRPAKAARSPRAGAQRKPTAAVPKQVPPSPAEDPVGAVVRTGLGVAGTGVRVAGALSRELLKRLPRP